MADVLQSRPLNASPGSFNWIYLIEYVTCGVLSLFFLFYFNRFFGTVVSYIIRLYSWHAYRVYIDIGALQISLLAGRIFFKDVRYHGDNETIFIHAGYLTWRYWLRSTKTCQRFAEKSSSGKSTTDSDSHQDHGAENGGTKRSSAELPCRITVNVSGVEAFLYNRSPSYDFVLENLQKAEARKGTTSAKEQSDSLSEKAGLTPHDTTSAFGLEHTHSSPSKVNDTLDSSSASLSPSLLENDPLLSPAPPSFLRLLPVHVQASTIAAVLGNHNTKSIITAKIASAEGEFDAGQSGPLDYFKFLIDFNIEHPVVKMMPNLDYADPQLSEAAQAKSAPEILVDADVIGHWRRGYRGIKSLFTLPKLRHSLESVALHADIHDSDHDPGRKRLDVPGTGRWEGLSRYLDDSKHGEHGEWDAVEYAKTSTLVDLVRVNFRFFWDIPGKVLASPLPSKFKTTKAQCDINGTIPPDYGMEIRVHGGQVNYGPWADRHRLALQQAFFPASYADAVPTLRLRAGDDRLCTVFDIFISIEEETVVRIPFREPSRDWRWRGRSAAYKAGQQSQSNQSKAKSRKKTSTRGNWDRGTAGADLRPFAWFDIVVKANSTIAYTMDMFPRSKGYANDLRVDVSGLEILSSLNHALLWKSKRVALDCDLSYPLSWRAVRDWRFNISILDLDFFLLRDHTFLLVDLIDDWSRGPRPDFYTFVPYRYLMNVKFDNFKLFLNVNDANIINHSDDMEENDFVVLFGSKLDSQLTIPLDRLNPSQSDIVFDVEAHHLGFELRLPSRNTLSALLPNKTVATLPSVIVKGVYNMRTEQAPNLTDTLNLDIIGDGLNMEFYGFFARQLVKVKENYFGEDVHFRTFEEYQVAHGQGAGAAADVAPPTEANDLDVILNIVARNCVVVAPAGLYDASEHVSLKIHTANVDLRVNNYYLELMVNSLPLELGCTYRTGHHLSEYSHADSQISIDGVAVFGHRLFGLAPTEPAYVSNWDIDAGEIVSQCSDHFLAKAVGAAQSFIATVEDKENAMPVSILPVLHDVTYVRFCCPLVSLCTSADDTAFVLDIHSVSGSFNDCAGTNFSQRLEMQIPEITFACMQGEAAHDNHQRRSSLETFAFIQTALNMTMVQRDAAFAESKRLQQEYVAVNDVRSRRATFLYSEAQAEEQVAPEGTRSDEPPSLNLPALPGPIEKHTSDRPSAVPLNIKHDSQIHNRAQGPPNLQDRTLALHSVFDKRHSPLQRLSLDLSRVPRLDKNARLATRRDSIASEPDIIFNPDLTDDAAHISLLFIIEPGITAYAQPRAVQAVGQLIDQLLPKHPNQVMDDFSVQTMSEVVASYGKDHGKNKILDVGVRLPQLRMRFVNDVLSEDSNQDGDQWDLDIRQADLSLRQKSVPERKDDVNATSVHTTVQSICVSAQPGLAKGSQNKAAFETTVSDVLVWLVDGERTSVHTSFQGIEATVDSERMDHLVQLIHQTTVLGEKLDSQFSSIVKGRSQRRRDLVYLLTQSGQSVGDPAFLNRPAYASRDSSEQLRNSDSWKIISRLRHILLNMSQEQRDQLVNDFFDQEKPCPYDAENYVVASLDTWRSWDAIRVRDSFAIRILFGSMGGIEKLHDRSKIPLGIQIQTRGIRLAVDPGDNENSFSLDSLSIGLKVEPPPPEAAVQIFHEHSGCKSTVLQLNTAKVDIHLNWRLFELSERLLNILDVGEPDRDQPLPEPLAETGAWDPENFHAVLATEIGTVSIATINTTHTFRSDALRISATGSISSDESRRVMSCNAISCARATSIDFSALQRTVYHVETKQPRLWVAFERETEPQIVRDTLNVAGKCEQIYFGISEEILGLIEMANAILSEEVDRISSLVSKHARSDQLRETRSSKSEVNHTFTPGVALCLDLYDIEIALTQNLQYAIRGDTVRLVLKPESDISGSFDTKMDLKPQSHEVSVLEKTQKRRVAATFLLPAISGQVKAVLAEELTTLSATVFLEDVDLDGSALYGLVNTLLSQKLSSTFDAISADANSLVGTIKEQFPPSKFEPAVEEQSEIQKKPVMFEVGLALAGFALSAHAPVKALESDHVNFSAFSGPIQIRVSNRPSNDGPPQPFPDCHIAMKHAGFELHETTDQKDRNIGLAKVAVTFSCTHVRSDSGIYERTFDVSILGPQVQIYPDTAPAAAEIVSHLQGRIQGLDLMSDKHDFKRLREFIPKKQAEESQPKDDRGTAADRLEIISNFTFKLEDSSIRYVVERDARPKVVATENDLEFSIHSIRMQSKSSKEARLSIVALQLRVAPKMGGKHSRTLNAANLPEMVFNVVNQSTDTSRRLSFRATGRAVEVLLDSQFILPLGRIEKSLTASVERTKAAVADMKFQQASGGLPARDILGAKKLEALTMDITFAGAVICLQSVRNMHSGSGGRRNSVARGGSQSGRYGQFSSQEGGSQAILRAPGVGAKVEFIDQLQSEASLNVEIKVDASDNTFSPTVVPVVLDMAHSIQQAIENQETAKPKAAIEDTQTQSLIDDEAIVQADPRAILGKTKLNVGFRICKQAFSLTCHPIAKIAASASIEDIYFTVNTVDSKEHGHFFAGSAAFYGFKLSLKHDYSQKPTFGFDMDSIMVSIMNSKHFGGTPGISAILRVNPTKTQVNAKSLQDILLFREIWLPAEIRNAAKSRVPVASDQQASSEYFVHRYHQLAAAKTFKWNATVAIAELSVDLDLGQAIGNVSLGISNLWASSQKLSSSQQSLCVGTDNVFVHSNGRMSGIVELHKVKARTSIAWPAESTDFEIPRIQGSISFDQIRVKASFDYQVFAIAHVTAFEFIMYNVRDEKKASGDRLVAILDGDEVHVYGIALSAALGFSLFQAFERLVAEQKDLYERSLKDVEKYLKRRVQVPAETKPEPKPEEPQMPQVEPRPDRLTLQTDVVVSLRSVDIGAFPTTLFDTQVLRLTASETQARFAVVDDRGRIRSGLGLELGQVKAALSSIPNPVVPKALADISIEEVVRAATTSSRGVILAVPRVVASMQTWQSAKSNTIDYIFRSSFEGKIDVGWNYARIGFIRGMWARHERALSSRLGKPLPESALQIHGAPQAPKENEQTESSAAPPPVEEQRLTAVVNLPMSKYSYVALEPPIIDTPQLRDMGDATPPLEWVGLNRDKLPNVTHQVIVLPLLEVAREVEDAYTRILGT